MLTTAIVITEATTSVVGKGSGGEGSSGVEVGSGVNVGVGSGVGYGVGVGVGSKEPDSNGVYRSFVDNKVP